MLVHLSHGATINSTGKSHGFAWIEGWPPLHGQPCSLRFGFTILQVPFLIILLCGYALTMKTPGFIRSVVPSVWKPCGWKMKAVKVWSLIHGRGFFWETQWRDWPEKWRHVTPTYRRGIECLSAMFANFCRKKRNSLPKQKLSQWLGWTTIRWEYLGTKWLT